jgi:hypothetical protein
VSDKIYDRLTWGCLIGAAILLALLIVYLILPSTSYADPIDAIYRNVGTWKWPTPTSGVVGAYWQVETDTGTQYAFQSATADSISIGPPDRIAVTPMRVRVRTCNTAFDCGQWSDWSNWAKGVPINYFPIWSPDVKRDQIFPSDWDAVTEMFRQDLRWR